MTEWTTILQKAILEKLPDIYEDIIWTDSFDHAISLIPKEGKFLVITSCIFHDLSSIHRGEVEETVLNQLKEPNLLGELIIKINSRSMIYVFSNTAPKDLKYLDGYIKKDIEGVDFLMSVITSFEGIPLEEEILE